MISSAATSSPTACCNRRGRDETMLLGASTMRGILEKHAAEQPISSRGPRLSKLSYAGQKKLTRLPRRSAIVAFSAEMVYTVAELIRRQQGGAAVVMGASRRAPAMRRSPSISLAKSTISWQPMPSAWA
jgi:hypothetical protein